MCVIEYLASDESPLNPADELSRAVHIQDLQPSHPHTLARAGETRAHHPVRGDRYPRGEVIEVVHVHHGDVPSATRARRSFERLATEGVTIFRQHEEATRLDETSRRTQVDASLVTCEIESAWKARASNGVVVRAHVAIEERFPPRAWR